jgi:hypothetical protein
MRRTWKGLFGWWSSGIESEASAHHAQRGLRTFVTFPSAIFAAALMSAGSIAGLPTRTAAQQPAFEAPQPGLFGTEGAIPPAGADGEVEGIETLTRGPVHEAFAAPAEIDPTPGEIVAKQPPPDIDEVPPDFRPEGAIWINGYWEWEPETKDYIWISGMWRVPPPDMRWVPPYWTETDGGWQRVQGFWIGAETRELEYRESPPESLEVGPTSPAPAEDYSYVPGTWLYQDTGYRWRTGYWAPYQPDWVWTPARWIWTPGGCIYSGGFWDHRPIVRAQMFAPLAFSSPLYLQPGFRYRPWCALNSSRFFAHLWIGPRANNYFFGNYYGVGSRLGFSPWCDWSYRSRRCFDPLWAWSNVHYRRQGVDYIGRVRGWHDHYRRNEFDRPGRTWREQSRLIADNNLDRRRSQNILAADFRDVARRDDLPMRFNRLDDRERDVVRTISDEHRQLRESRNRLEREARIARGGDARIGEGRGPGSREPGSSVPGDRGPGDRDLADGQSPRGDRTETNRPDREGREGTDRREGDAPRRPGDLASNRDESDRGPGRERGPGRDGESPREGRTARVTLPEQSEAAREVARNSRRQLPEGIGRPDADDRSRGESRADRPGRPQTGAGRGPEVARERGPAGTREGRAETSRDGRSDAAREGRPVIGSEGRETRESRPTVDRSPADTAPGVETPRTERPRGESRPEGNRRPELEATSPRSETTRPSVDPLPTRRPGESPPWIREEELERRRQGRQPEAAGSELPRTNVPRSERPRVEAPRPNPGTDVRRSETPRNSTPRTETRRIETPRVEAPRSERPSSAPRSETRTTPRVETPRVETRSTPRIETRSEPRSRPERSSAPSRPSDRERSSAAPRISLPSASGSSSRGSSARTVAPSRSSSAPRVQSRPSTSARMQASRSSSPSRSSASSRGSSSRPQAARSSGGGGSRSSGKGRGRD